MTKKPTNNRALKGLDKKLTRIENDFLAEVVRLKAYYVKRQSQRDPYITSHEILAVKVTFHKPDAGQDAEEICFGFNENSLTQPAPSCGLTMLYKLLLHRFEDDTAAMLLWLAGSTYRIEVLTASQRQVDL